MISFEQFILDGVSPIYIQIILYIKRGIVAGKIQTGDELPSRRVLSSLLGVNPNTVQKAYHLLEEEGMIVSRSGSKSYVDVDISAVERIRAQLLDSDAKALVRKIKQMGIGKEEAFSIIEKIWEE